MCVWLTLVCKWFTCVLGWPRSLYVAEDDLKFLSFLLQFPKYWDHRCPIPHLTTTFSIPGANHQHRWINVAFKNRNTRRLANPIFTEPFPCKLLSHEVSTSESIIVCYFKCEYKISLWKAFPEHPWLNPTVYSGRYSKVFWKTISLSISNVNGTS